MTEFDVCVLGSANLDLVATVEHLPAPGETVIGTSFAEHAGGKGLNQAVAAARSGASVAFVGALGADAAATTLRAVMAAAAIDASHVATVAAPTGRALIGVARDGENSIVVVPGANAAVVADHVPRARVLLTQLEVPLAAVETAIAAARAAGTITVLNPAPARQLGESLLRHCDIVVPNEHEVALLGGAAHLLALGVHAVVVTLGARGAEVHTTAGTSSVPAFDVAAIDTTGAGDTFCGALAARLAAGDELPAALRFASAAAALSTIRAGAVPSIPHRLAVQELLTNAG